MESDSFLQDYMTKNSFDLGHGAATSHMPQSLFYSKNGGGQSLKKPIVAPNPSSKGKYIFEPQKGIDDFSSGSSSSSEDIDEDSSESEVIKTAGYRIKSDIALNQGPHLEEFTLGKRGGETVKIDFAKAKTMETHQDLKTSCLCLIDQLAHYYDSFYDSMKQAEQESEGD